MKKIQENKIIEKLDWSCFKSKNFVYIFVVLIAFFNFHFFKSYLNPSLEYIQKNKADGQINVWLNAGFKTDYHMKWVLGVFTRYGFNTVNGSETDDWEFLWSWSYPFNLKEMDSLKPHQRVNHIPGNGNLVDKSVLTLNTESKYIPKAFKDESKFKEYAKLNPDKRFVQKHIANRGVALRNVSEIEFTNKEFFVQEFVENVLLVDGLAFDIGVYVIITSINPLRVYTFRGDVLVRFCLEPYHPFNASNFDQYVIHGTYNLAWWLPSIAKFSNTTTYSIKESLNAHFESKGYDMNIVWDQIEDAVATILLDKEPLFVEAV